MASSQPELVGANGRRFAGFAAAVLVFIVDPVTRRFLLLSSLAERADWRNCRIIQGGGHAAVGWIELSGPR
jgi:hypothetical protein